jgi:hypothetical protein
MASSILESDLIEGSVGVRNINGKNSMTRNFLVGGVTGAVAQKPIEALQTVGLPQPGDAHPNFTDLFVVDSNARPIPDSNEKWIVSIIYGVPESGSQKVDTSSQVSFGSTLASIETTKDNTGAALFTGTLDPLADGTPPARTATTAPKQPAVVNKLVPQITVMASRKETSLPITAIKDYTGKINSDIVSIAGNSFAVKTLMMTRVNAVTENDGTSYLVTYEFQFRSDQWKIDIVGIDPDTGAPWSKIESVTDGIKNVEIYETVAMNGLGL